FVASRSVAGIVQPGDQSSIRRSTSAKSSCRIATSASGDWKKNMYQERRICAALVVNAPKNCGPYGTAAVTILENRAGARSAPKYVATAPQSWPNTTACSLSSASSSATTSSPSAIASKRPSLGALVGAYPRMYGATTRCPASTSA